MWRAHDRSRLGPGVPFRYIFIDVVFGKTLEEQILDSFKISNKGFAH
jgi:hypothetical protein